jgi:hypothetical protein
MTIAVIANSKNKTSNLGDQDCNKCLNDLNILMSW